MPSLLAISEAPISSLAEGVGVSAGPGRFLEGWLWWLDDDGAAGPSGTLVCLEMTTLDHDVAMTLEHGIAMTLVAFEERTLEWEC